MARRSCAAARKEDTAAGWHRLVVRYAVEQVVTADRGPRAAIRLDGEQVTVADLRADQPAAGDQRDEQGGAVGDARARRRPARARTAPPPCTDAPRGQAPPPRAIARRWPRAAGRRSAVGPLRAPRLLGCAGREPLDHRAGRCGPPAWTRQRCGNGGHDRARRRPPRRSRLPGPMARDSALSWLGRPRASCAAPRAVPIMARQVAGSGVRSSWPSDDRVLVEDGGRDVHPWLHAEELARDLAAVGARLRHPRYGQ